MNMPNEILNLAYQGLDSMYQHPKNHFDWRIRREIYRELHKTKYQKGKDVHGWIAVLSATYVLPIFTQTFPTEKLPIRLLNKAMQILKQSSEPNTKRVNQLLEQGYNQTGLDAIDWRLKTAYNAELAGMAAYKALLEVCGQQDLLENNKNLIISEISNGAAWRENNTFTDEDIAYLAAFSDTASTAAISFACAVESYRIRNDPLRLFWEWWVNTCLSTAWSRAFEDK